MAAERRKIHENEKLLLHSEVGGVCPKCPKTLVYEKNGRNQKAFDIAHIYPFNPTAEEITLLEREERLNDDPDHYDNLICLCISCHKKYDKGKTVEEYRSLVQIKKEILRRNVEKELWTQTSIENEIFEIIDDLVTQELDFTDVIEYDPKTINDKIDNTITILSKRKIHSNVQDFFFRIQAKFKELDFIQPMTTEVISSQIRTHYLVLAKQNRSKQEIFDAMVLWLQAQTKQTNKEASEIIVSYFIQNCEIF